MNVRPLLGILALTMFAGAACGSSDKSSTASAPTVAGSAATSLSSTATSAASSTRADATTISATTTAGKTQVQMTVTGDINGTLTPLANTPLTCGQTGADSVVIRGTVSGHTGQMLVTAGADGTVQFPSKTALASVTWSPDGGSVSGSPLQYTASSFTTGTGTLTFGAAGASGSMDLVLPVASGSPGAAGAVSVHVIATWVC